MVFISSKMEFWLKISAMHGRIRIKLLFSFKLIKCWKYEWAPLNFKVYFRIEISLKIGRYSKVHNFFILNRIWAHSQPLKSLEDSLSFGKGMEPKINIF